ncbi:aminomethyl-transferring glycine dehydrogenase [Roseibacillus ishigakijimensis]|uniref:Glycine dehydrogenase (decarboxylating) n=1 Tax=Roseibacillus ishigakijimensis TaxID=454146 RepID=A0A934VMS1_9BACT|nr:aminomethyl-transferring glycine dehydrogenase [Roseibacillus ishigakijimensis]MBK1834572.1 aminomethyl-transferring glycine dehydrogenase [Roseibacillus ishigakijimensis]
MSAQTEFKHRHLGVGSEEVSEVLARLGYSSLEELTAAIVPEAIRKEDSLSLPEPLGEREALAELKGILSQNQVARSYLGQGYHGTILPPVIQRNLLENPGWYTAYTPYQPEIAQGRLEALLNFQTMVTDLTGLDVANASLLDEGTAAAEAMTLARAGKPKGTVIFVDEQCHPQTLAVVQTRAEPLDLEVRVGDWREFDPAACEGLFAALVQYPDTRGEVHDYAAFAEKVHAAKALVIVAADPLALVLLKEPGAWGADICVGSTQRFGVPMGGGGPHAAYIAVKDALKRKLPGRLVGISRDSQGEPAFRLALQTREQHIRRDKATSNICTAQVLLAVIASMYAVYHGPEGLREIARRTHGLAHRFADGLRTVGLAPVGEVFFDTVTVRTAEAKAIVQRAGEAGYNFRLIGEDQVSLAFDELSTAAELPDLLGFFGAQAGEKTPCTLPAFSRESEILTHEVFHRYRSETEMMRYLRRLEGKDLALNQAMIPLGSCTMKLNAAAEMIPVTWAEVGEIHPFAPAAQVRGYAEMLTLLEDWLAEITGFAAVSLQPNAGSQGEYAGLLAIRRYHQSRGDHDRHICLIPTSAHGTNPASAVMLGMKVVPVKCDLDGNIDLADLRAKAEKHADQLAALMVTYPSTHGVFEEGILEICETVHQLGGQVYMDGANMNAQVGLTSPGLIGADVCHLNLHKTFCIPHGGGGPGIGPIGVASHLVPFLPDESHPVSAAPWGSASINVISWMYIRMMGAQGLTEATQVSLLLANYIARQLESAFPVLYKGRNGLVAHECIIDVREVSKASGLTVEDIAKRLIDYGFHAPTMSWPVAGTLMIEPTESESLREANRFCEAMRAIAAEMEAVAGGEKDPEDNVLKNAPHTAAMVTADEWNHPYSRSEAAWPVAGLREWKFWSPVGRVDNVHGDRNLVCTCEGMDAYAED